MHHTVMALLKAKFGTENKLKDNLLNIAQLTRQEDGCIEFYLYQDPNNPSQFGLYEQWRSKELYQKQFTKTYVIEFLSQAESLLEKPYQGFSGNEIFVKRREDL